MLALVLLILAFFLFLAATFGFGGRFNLIAAGLAAWVLSQLVTGRLG